MEFIAGKVSGGKKLAVQNKTAARVQITAEQLLREAVERQSEDARGARQRIVDADELQDYRVRKRKEFEDSIRRQRQHLGTWIKYAQWEAAQKEFRRARSVFERALDVDYQNASLWLKYIEMEVKNKFVSSARNLFDRVTGLLPRVDQFWFKYAHMEELLGNFAGGRAIFERWMRWEPEEKSWMMYVHFEERCQEIDRARKIFERFVGCHPTQKSFLKLTKFEERHRSIPRARGGFEKTLELLPTENLDSDFFIKFAEFEERQKEMERAKAIYENALKLLPSEAQGPLHDRYVTFEKMFGRKEDIDSVVFDKRRAVYEQALKENPHDYDAWFDYIRLEESSSGADVIREVYERAIAQVPPIKEKRYWKRYVYLWINYALFEELSTEGNIDRCRKVFEAAMKVIPHSSFSFAKLWIYFAEFEVRQLDIDKARKIYGHAIGGCGKSKIFEAYAALELRLGNIDRCRKIFARFIEKHPTDPRAWIALIELEQMAEEISRRRAVCEIAVGMGVIDMPELVWKAYIDAEIALGEIQRARHLYERMLSKKQHIKIFKSFSDFEVTHGDSVEKARSVLEWGLKYFKDTGMDEERADLLAHFLAMEKSNGTKENADACAKRQPKKVVKRVHLLAADGSAEGWQEETAYQFPEDATQASTMKILEAARLWKKKKIEADRATPEVV